MIDYRTNESWVWHGPTQEVRFQVFHDGKPILCRVTRECIANNCGNPTGEDACFTAAKEHFEAITDQVGSYIFEGRFEADGSVVLRTVRRQII